LINGTAERKPRAEASERVAPITYRSMLPGPITALPCGTDRSEMPQMLLEVALFVVVGCTLYDTYYFAKAAGQCDACCGDSIRCGGGISSVHMSRSGSSKGHVSERSFRVCRGVLGGAGAIVGPGEK
jgi:hypothetical protein